MSNEHNDNDALVSATYRDSAQETTPPHLDEAILRMATQGKSANVSERFSTWMTPLTWAVTAGLCVALVMNVPDVADHAQLPETASPASSPPAASIEEAFLAEDADVVEEAEKMASMRDGPDQPAPAARARLEQSKRQSQDLADTAVENRVYGTDASVSSEAVAAEMYWAKEESDRESLCDEKSREQADSWYECVVDLRDQGRTEDASVEMLELVEQFPDFQPE